MGEVKRRWNVTYTKHVKQKRKVYQDGAMEVFRLPSGVEKATLYDESGSVLASRYLKKEECVESNGTLAFDSHLVDVGDLEGDCEQYEGFDDVEGKGDVKFVCRVGRFGGKRSGLGSSNLIDTKKCGMGRNWASESSQNLIRNNKRGGMSTKALPKGNEATGREKTGVSRTCPSAMEISAKEWYALYTTQITQKAKKYHDGTLRLEFRGSHGKQVMLYDSARKVLDTRFLKKDEAVGPGETLVFDALLVDVGEPKENNEGGAGSTGGQQKQKILQDFKQENNEGAPGSAGGQQKQNTPQDFKKEWHAMYTTPKTQKSKKYHDGILQLSVSLCNQKQAVNFAVRHLIYASVSKKDKYFVLAVTLLNEHGAVLSSKYLNSAAGIRTGNSLEITNYLVDIGDPTMVHRGETKGSSLGKDIGSHAISSNVDKRIGSGNAKLIRDAHQILSTLKRPIAPPSSGCTNTSFSQPTHSLKSSQFESTIQGKPSEHDMQHPNLLKNEVIYDSKDSLQNSEVRGRGTMSTLGSNISHSKAAEDFAVIEIKNLSDEPKSNISLGLATSDILVSEPNVSCPEKCMKASTSSIAKYRVPDIVQPEDVQTQGVCATPDKLNNIKTKLTATPSGDDGKITNNDAYKNSNQLSVDMVDDGGLGECTTMAFSIPCDSASSHVNDAEGKSLEKKMNVKDVKMKMDEFPSFDMGF